MEQLHEVDNYKPTHTTKSSWIFFARARHEMLFLVVLHYKMRRRPPKPGPGPSPARELRRDASSGMVMSRIFSTRNNRIFFRPGPNSARPEKCSPLLGWACAGFTLSCWWGVCWFIRVSGQLTNVIIVQVSRIYLPNHLFLKVILRMAGNQSRIKY
jgi:hypothetical protein